MKKRLILLVLVAFFAGRCLAGNEQSEPGTSPTSESPGATQSIGGLTPNGKYTKSGHYLEVPLWLAKIGCQSTPNNFPYDVDWTGNSNTIALKTADSSSEQIPQGTYLTAKLWVQFPGFPDEFRGDKAIDFGTELSLARVVIEAYLPGGNAILGIVECEKSSPSSVPAPTMTTTPTGNSSNADVCNKVRNTVRDELALAVDLFNSYSISLTELGQIFQYWAELNESVLGTTSGAVKTALKSLIGYAKSVGAAARNGDSYTASNYVVKFTDALGPMDSACR